MKYKIGFIGCGNMAQAIIGGLISNAGIKPVDIIAADANEAAVKKAAEAYKICETTNNSAAAVDSEVLFLSVKPQFYETVIKEIRDILPKNQLIITIGPGKTLDWLAERLGDDKKIIRTMPNTPALVGEGITAVCPNEKVTSDDLQTVCDILESFGKAEIIKETMMDAVIAVSGSSPAYVFMFIEAMADAAVAEGMPRAQAYEFAAQSVFGSAKMVLDIKKHPGELKDMVCSPAGTTIEAVRVLEQTGFRSSVMEAMKACADKSRNM